VSCPHKRCPTCGLTAPSIFWVALAFIAGACFGLFVTAVIFMYADSASTS
jgi:RsiW-degrading membrane proteinase PrsW (M82 family)